jgi:nitrile hydratase subunit beta
MSYRPGDCVRVSSRSHAGHHRTPGYLKGKVGTIERLHGSFKDPETRAYGGDGLPTRPLYSVAFVQRELWPNYGGEAADRLNVDLYEHWLEPAR